MILGGLEGVIVGLGVAAYGALKKKRKGDDAVESMPETGAREVLALPISSEPEHRDMSWPLTDVARTHQEIARRNPLTRPFTAGGKIKVGEKTARVVEQDTRLIAAVAAQHGTYLEAFNKLERLRQEGLALQQEAERLTHRSGLMPLEAEREATSIRAQIAQNQASVAESEYKIASLKHQAGNLSKPEVAPSPTERPRQLSREEKAVQLENERVEKKASARRSISDADRAQRVIDHIDEEYDKKLNKLYE